MTKKIPLTDQDIRNSKRNNPTRCPLARLLRRAGFISPLVLPHLIQFTNRYGEATVLRTTKRARGWIQDFDNYRAWRFGTLVLDNERGIADLEEL